MDSTINVDGIKMFAKEIIALSDSGTIPPVITSVQVPDINAFVNKIVDSSYLKK